jgi:hypothetical protein
MSIASALTLNCDFRDHRSYWGLNYACVVQNLSTNETDRTITDINGTHVAGKTNDDITKVLVEHQQCKYLPLNVGAHFKNLEVLYVMKSHVEKLTNKDLDGLTKLKIFDVSYNPIKRLHKDFFVGHESIQIVSFYDCSLNFIETGALEALTNLKEGHFQFNECVDFRADQKMLLSTLVEKLEESCDPANPNHKKRGFEEYAYREVDYDESREDYEFFVPTTTTTTQKPKEVIKIKKELYCDLPFTQRHANPIILILIAIVLCMVGLMYRSNSFERLL